MYSDEFLERFWAKVDKKGPDDCWEWTASKTMEYGTINIEGKRIYAHRVSLQIKLGREIGEGLVAKHACDNKGCINPNHLSEGTYCENQKEAYERGLRMPVKHKGSKNPKSNLTETDVIEIREIYEKGMLTQKEIAELYKITSTNISQIITRKTWTHI